MSTNAKAEKHLRFARRERACERVALFVCGGGRAGNRMFGPPGVCRSLLGLVGLLRDGCNDRLLRVRT